MTSHIEPSKKISFFSSHIPPNVINIAAKTLESKWVNVRAETVKVEEDFAKKFYIKYAVALNSCTAALQLALAIASWAIFKSGVTCKCTCNSQFLLQLSIFGVFHKLINTMVIEGFKHV